MSEGESNVWSYTWPNDFTYDKTYAYWYTAVDTASNFGGDFWSNEANPSDAIDWNEGEAEEGLTHHYHSGVVYPGSTIQQKFHTSYDYTYFWMNSYTTFGEAMDATDFDGAVIKFRIFDTNDEEYRAYMGMSSNASDYWNYDCSSGYAEGLTEADGWISLFWKFPDSHPDCDLTSIQTMRFQLRTISGNFDSTSDYIEIDYIYFVRTGEFTVTDGVNPTLTNPDHSPESPDENDSVTFQVDASDSHSGIKTGFPKVYIAINLGIPTGYAMTLDSGSTYKYIYGTFDLEDHVDYYFYVVDNDDNTYTLDNEGNYYGMWKHGRRISHGIGFRRT